MVTIMTIASVVTSADSEIGAAATVNPDAAFIEAPGLTEDAGCFAALANQANAAEGVRAAAAEIEIVRRAIKGANTSAKAGVIRVVAGSYGEVSAATAVNPNAVACDAPGAAINAGRFAALTNDLNATVGVEGAEVAVKVVGRAVERVSMIRWHRCRRATGCSVERW